MPSSVAIWETLAATAALGYGTRKERRYAAWCALLVVVPTGMVTSMRWMQFSASLGTTRQKRDARTVGTKMATLPCAADFADWARLGMADANSALEGVAGLSSSPATPLFLFLGSPKGPSSSIGRSGSPHSAPSKVRNSRSRSCLKRLSFCSMRFSSMYSASSSASSWGVRF